MTSKGGKLVAAAVLALLVGIDFVVLKGDSVAHINVPLDGSRSSEFAVSEVGEPHLISIRTIRRSTSSKSKGRSIYYRVSRADGQVVAEEDEIVSRKTRYVRFTPDTAATYRVEVRDSRSHDTTRSQASVNVLVNDRRILPRLLNF